MEFSHFIEWAFYGIISGSAVYGVSVLASMKKSIEMLNERVATIIEKTSWHERELDRHGERLSRLEGEH